LSERGGGGNHNANDREREDDAQIAHEVAFVAFEK
jgi:hypothetical protein